MTHHQSNSKFSTSISLSFILSLLLCVSFSINLSHSEETKSTNEQKTIEEFVPTGDSVQDFENWYLNALKSSAAKINEPKITLKKKEDGSVGVFAKTDLKANEEFIRIPFNLMITADRILVATELEDVLVNEDLSPLFRDDQTLAFYLAWIRNSTVQHPWKFWVDLLPSEFSSILYFTDTELSFLRGSALYQKALDYKQTVQDMYNNKMLPLMKNHTTVFETPFSISDWIWGNAVVQSRSLTLKDSSGRAFKTIIPFFDFIRHNESKIRNAFGYKAANRFFHAESTHDFKEGEEISTFLGPFSNGELLFDRGYILNSNLNEYVTIPTVYLTVNQDDVLFERKQKLMQDFFQDKKNDTFFLSQGGMSSDLAHVARLILATENDFNELGILKSRISQRTEHETQQFFYGLFSAMLGAYPNDLQFDYELTRDESRLSTLSPRARLAFEAVLSEKLILFQNAYTLQQILDEREKRGKDEL